VDQPTRRMHNFAQAKGMRILCRTQCNRFEWCFEWWFECDGQIDGFCPAVPMSCCSAYIDVRACL